MRFLIRANSPISVIAHNYARDGSGDSFTVLSKEMAGTTYALSIPHISSIGYAAIYFFPIKKDTNIDITVVGENSTDSRKITAKDNATFVYRRSGAAFSLYARGNNPYHVVVGVRRYKSDEIAGLTTSMNYMPLPLPAPGCNIGGSQFDCISDMKLSNKFTVTPPAQGCPPFDVELQGKSVADRFSVDPKKPQPVRSWKSNLGDFGVIRPRSSYLQCVRLGGGKTSEGKTVGPFMDTMPSQLQFINGTIYFIARSTNEMMTIIAEENAKKNMSMDNRKIEEKEWKTMKYGNKVVYYCTLKITGSEYHSVHSNGYYIAQITGITNSESSYGYFPALHAITVTPPEPTESTPVTTRTQPPSPSSSSTPPIKASTTKKASTTTKATVPATSTIMTSSIVSSTQGSKISTSTAPSQSTTSGTSSLIKRNAVVISAFAMALLTLRSPFNTLF
ncbi:hypothetical protein AB6A40_006164 [Gnathostoma spinigerum]|uniref:IgGFc-binding protein N-terminal domain-containing protein n=1 Tax=Gnathostoma spinigerum TaxID=75299 RepID=A0ABD6ET76_9BILA